MTIGIKLEVHSLASVVRVESPALLTPTMFQSTDCGGVFKERVKSK
jgi:hypothetical protein